MKRVGALLFSSLYLLFILHVSTMDQSYSPIDHLLEESKPEDPTNDINFQDAALHQGSRRLAPKEFPYSHILGSEKVRGGNIIASRDGKTVFLAVFEGPLQIWNVSDPSSPSILGQFELRKSFSRGMVVSSDTQRLYVAGFQTLEIIDISNLKDPKRVGEFVVAQAGQKVENPKEIPIIKVSSDCKTAYVGFYGLKIFDISDPQQIKLIYSRIDKTLSNLHLMKDDKTLIFANTGLEILDVSKPSTPVPITQLKGTSQIFSMTVTADEKLAYLVFEDLDSRSPEILIKVLDLSDFRRLQINELQSYLYGWNRRPSLTLSKNESHLFLIGDHALGFINKKTLNAGNIFAETIYMPVSFDVSVDRSLGFVVTEDQLFILDLLVDIDVETTIDFNPSQMKYWEESAVSHMTYSWDTDILSVYNPKKNMIVVKSNFLSSKSDDQAGVKRYKMEPPSKIQISKDGTLLFVAFETTYEVIKINPDFERISVFKSSNQSPLAVQFVLSSDERTLFVTEQLDSKIKLTKHDISNPKEVKELSSTELPVSSISLFTVTSDYQTVFLLSDQKNISVFDISDPLSPTQITSLLPDHDFAEFILSPINESIAFLVSTNDKIDSFTIIDFSNLHKPKIISSLTLPLTQKKKQLKISSNSKTALVSLNKGMAVIDISRLSSPTIYTILEQSEVFSFLISKDCKRPFVVLSNILNTCEVGVYDLLPEYTLHLPTPTANYRLGSSHSSNLEVLRINGNRRYDVFIKPYKLMKVSLYKNKIVPTRPWGYMTYPSLPNWIHFDSNNATLAMEPRLSSHLGLWNLHGVFSTQVSPQAFSILEDQGKDKTSIYQQLFTFGKIDTEGFLTPSYDPKMPLEFLIWTNEYQVRQILNEHYFQVATSIYVEPSLSLSKGNRLSIETLLHSSMSVTLSIPWNSTSQETPNAQFLSLHFQRVGTSFSNNSTNMTLEGLPDDINAALERITIHLHEEGSHCNGSITIYDGANPTITEEIFNLSSYFKINKAPAENLKLLVKHIPAVIGEEFKIVFDRNSFHDENQDALTFIIRTPGSNKVDQSWINFDNATLQLSGTPPKKITQLWHREIELELVVSNEFRKSHPVRFTIGIEISLSFVIEVLKASWSYVLSSITVFFFLSRLYHSIWANLYCHPKKFRIFPGKPLSNNSIYPISFIAEEQKISKHIEDKMRQQIAQESQKNKLKDFEFVEYFIDNDSFDKAKLLRLIENVIQTLDFNENEDLKYFASRMNLYKRLICDIIYYNMLEKNLNLSREKKTKEVFNAIKKNWIKFVELDRESQLIINDTRLDAKLDSLDQGAQEPSETSKLIEKNHINRELIRNALIGHAFQFHNLNFSIHDIDINVMEKVQKRSLLLKCSKWVKVDHVLIPANEKGKVGYGIKYKIRQNTLSFQGTPEDSFVGRTLVIQITTVKKKILRELNVLGCEGAQEIELIEESL